MTTDTEREAWESAYAAFKGAFDTPQQRRQMPDEYSEDARRRMRDFNERFTAARASTPAAPERTEAARARAMFVARLENMRKNGDCWLTVVDVLSLLNDCDMLAACEAPAAAPAGRQDDLVEEAKRLATALVQHDCSREALAACHAAIDRLAQQEGSAS